MLRQIADIIIGKRGAPLAAGAGVRRVATTFRRILVVVCLMLVFAVVQMLMLRAVCDAGMATAASLERQGLPALSKLASVQEHLAIYRLNSYEYLFAHEEERAALGKTVEALAVKMRGELHDLSQLLPDGEGSLLVGRLRLAVDELDAAFLKVRGLVDTDFNEAMNAMDREIPPKTGRVAAAAAALKDYGYKFSGGQAQATFGSFGGIKQDAVMFGTGNIAVAFGAVLFVVLAARRSSAQLAETLAKLADTHRLLVDTSRQAGMAEVATGVLHNVGNVLNSVNVSATLAADKVRHSKTANVGKLAALFDEHRADLAEYLTRDPKGRIIPGYLGSLRDSLADEQKTIIAELEHLRKNVDHIKDIVAMQQNYAKTSGFIETVSLAELVEDVLRMNAASLLRHEVEVVRDFQIRGAVTTDKHKVIQVLVNLVRNAKHACSAASGREKRITVRLAGDGKRVCVTVSDNGVGIPSENLLRIFNHGFTTKKNGHGFGLHSGALTAKELGGALTVQSDGPGQGATFVFELPCDSNPATPENPVR